MAAALVLTATPQGARAACRPAPAWPAWAAFSAQFISADGRVVDPASPHSHSTSEGQAYALFFALVAGDRAGFERLLRWTENNLAAGDLSQRLPAWQWGRRDDGRWGVIDANAAADADLWLLYTLAQAGRLWQAPRYIDIASRLAERVLQEESLRLPGLGRVLLPGPAGFVSRNSDGALTAVKLNPSYWPLPVLRWLASHSGHPEWAAVFLASVQLLQTTAPRGLAPDWVRLEAAPPPWRPSTAADLSVGSYDAIRVYLWLGLSAAAEPERNTLLRHYSPMLDRVEAGDGPPEQVQAQVQVGGRAEGRGPAGFAWALRPMAQALRHAAAGRTLARAVTERPTEPAAYYGQALTLFAQGHLEHRYRFESDGALTPQWHPCNEP
ncbi:MAG: cellulose synthase complex periplasmic endoglucanase BcsZ [Burkholderiales bacterium]